MLPRPASRPGGNFSQFGFNPAPADRPVTLGLSSLDVGMPLTGVAVTTSRSGPVTTAFGADFVQFLFFDQAVSAGRTCISVQFTTTPVPKPQTYDLMLVGPRRHLLPDPPPQVLLSHLFWHTPGQGPGASGGRRSRGLWPRTSTVARFL